MSDAAVLELIDVSKRYDGRASRIGGLLDRMRGRSSGRVVRAVDGVSLALREREMLALVGESGCGKSTVGRIATGVLGASEGEVRYDGVPLGGLTGARARAQRLAVQMIFQNPREALNPRHRIGWIVAEPALRHGFVRPHEAQAYVGALLSNVGLHADVRTRFPHELSGGQCQRVGIARALAVQPRVLVCDEPVSALDVSVQAQILNLFLEMRQSGSLSFVFISHDLSVVRQVSERVAVMYLGRIVETAATPRLFSYAHHPYTQALMAAAPQIHQRRQIYAPIKGEVPSPLRPPAGCHFHPRCPLVMPRCSVEAPRPREIAPGHWSACHLEPNHPSLPKEKRHD